MSQQQPFTTGDLAVASAVHEQSPRRFLLRVPDGWQQGRGAFGGLVLAALVRAVEASEPEKDRLVRSVNAEIAGPVLAGEASIEVSELRRGNGLSAYSATLSQQGQSLVHLSAVLARARSATPLTLHVQAPSPPPFQNVAVVSIEMAEFAPKFAQHIEFRLLTAPPFSGAEKPVSEGWVRFKTAPPAIGAPEVVALADAWWPAVFATSTAPRPIGTVTFALQHFVPSAPLDPALPLYYRAHVVAEQDGYLVEMRELWSQDGKLVALNQQTIAWIR